MPFASSNQKTFNLAPGLRATIGEWTGAVGDATSTIAIQGGIVWGAQFRENSAGNWIEANWSWTTSGGTITLTVENIAGVTDGQYIVFHG